MSVKIIVAVPSLSSHVNYFYKRFSGYFFVCPE